jgi:5-aminolevulinate synthase
MLILQEKQIKFDPTAPASEQCPHARAAREAAAKAEKDRQAQKAAGTFDYQKFYEAELDKKHKDK